MDERVVGGGYYQEDAFSRDCLTVVPEPGAGSLSGLSAESLQKKFLKKR